MSTGPIPAIVLAAGLSSRMGRPKPLLPFGSDTLVGSLVSILLQTPVSEVVVVTGHAHEAVERELASWPVRCIYNPDYAEGEMLSSVQAGLRGLGPGAVAVVLVLCDQPGLVPATVARLVDAYRAGEGLAGVRPVFGGRPGHPILVARQLWADILALPWTASLRDVLRAHAAKIAGVDVDSPGILRDIDTPEDYARELAAFEQTQVRQDG